MEKDTENDFQTNLLRVLCAQLHSLLLLTIAQEKFGKGYMKLSPIEQHEAENATASVVTHFSSRLTSEAVNAILNPTPLPPPKVH